MKLENTWSSLCVWVVCLAVLYSWLEEQYIVSFILELYISSFILKKILKTKTSFNLLFHFLKTWCSVFKIKSSFFLENFSTL